MSEEGDLDRIRKLTEIDQQNVAKANEIFARPFTSCFSHRKIS